tara:strand:+ start:534 stop:1214 length:681 start_codon:yes stop_codon:yes gene_type:complete
MNEIFLDTETTGLSVEQNHRVVEIACIETNNLVPTGKIFYKLINPERKIPEEATKIHGYTNEKLEQEPKFKEIANEFLEFISGKKLIIHNAPFDIGFLNNELKKANMKILDDKKNVIDTLDFARSKYPGSSNSLDNLCKKFNIDLSKRTKHNALLDCELLRKVYINLIGEKEPSLIFQEDTGSENVSLDRKKTINKDYLKTVIGPSNQEIENHKKFLKHELRKNYF